MLAAAKMLKSHCRIVLYRDCQEDYPYDSEVILHLVDIVHSIGCGLACNPLYAGKT